MCPETGKPYYLFWNKETRTVTKEYSIPSVDIPKHLLKYLVGRGHLFHAYTEQFNERHVFTTDVRTFLEAYPSWEDVIQSEHYTDEYADAWNEDNHNEFKELLEFLSEQQWTYSICWSY